MDENNEVLEAGEPARIVPLRRKFTSGDDGTRTRDPLLAKQVL